MPRAKPQPPPPPASYRTVLGIALGIGAVVLGVPALVVVTHTGDPAKPQVSPLEAAADRWLAQVQAQDPPTRYEKAAAKKEELAALVNDPGFPQLPPAKQEQVRDRLRRLTAFLDYEKGLAAIPVLETVQTEAQFQQIEAQLLQLSIPPECRLEWPSTAAGQRHDRLRTDVLALNAALNFVRQGYQKLVVDGVEVVKTKTAANLPARANAVLVRAAKLPKPESGLVPGSPRMTYRTVFGFDTVQETYQRGWLPLQTDLKELATLSKN